MYSCGRCPAVGVKDLKTGEVTEKGRRLRVEVDAGSPDRRLEESMVAICCEGLEVAIAAGIVKSNEHSGEVYIVSPGRHWAIGWCPWCGVERNHLWSESVVVSRKPRRKRARGE